MVNGDPNTYLYRFTLKVTFPNPGKSGYTFRNVVIAGSNYAEAKEDAVNIFKMEYPECEIAIVDVK